MPERAALDVAADVLAADQRDVIAEFFDKHVDQHAAVLVFLFRHVAEDAGGVGVILLQALGEVGVDAAILLLVADGQRQDFAFGQVGKGAHRQLSSLFRTHLNKLGAGGKSSEHGALADRGRERALVEVVEFAADRHAMGEPRRFHLEMRRAGR